MKKVKMKARQAWQEGGKDYRVSGDTGEINLGQ